MPTIIYKELSYKICGLCFETHNALGRYRNEQSYTDYIEQSLIKAGLKYSRELALPTSFNGEKDRRHIPDFVIEDKIIVDLKAKRMITKDDYFQMKRYLISSGKRLGIIVNFRQQYLSPKES